MNRIGKLSMVFACIIKCLLVHGMLDTDRAIQEEKKLYSELSKSYNDDAADYSDRYKAALEKVQKSLALVKKNISENGNETDEEDGASEKGSHLQSVYELLLEDLHALSADGKYGIKYNELNTGSDKQQPYSELLKRIPSEEDDGI